MANNTWDQEILNQRERPLSSDNDQEFSQTGQTLRNLLSTLFQGRISASNFGALTPIQGFFGQSLQVQPTGTPGGQIVVKAGLGFMYNAADIPTAIGGVPGVNDLAAWKPLLLINDYSPGFTVPTAPSGPNTRIDIIEVLYNRHLADSASRDVLDPSTGVFVPTLVNKTLAWDLDSSIGSPVGPLVNNTAALGYKYGVAGVSPSPPANSPGYITIAQINVGSGQTVFDYDSINDLRQLLWPYNAGRISCNVNMPSSSSLVPTLTDVVAPSGVHVCAVGNNNTNAKVDVYIWGGVLANSVLPVAEVSSQNALTTLQAAVSIVTADSTLQSAVSGANASPVSKVAVGQSVIKVELTAGTPGSPQKYALSLSLAEG